MIKHPTYRANTLAYIYQVSDRHNTQEKINKQLRPFADADTISSLKLTVWEYVLTEYANEFTLRRSDAFAEWFSAQWHSHNVEIVQHVLPVLIDFSVDNYALYQRMKFGKVYPNEAVIAAARREYFESVDMTVKA